MSDLDVRIVELGPMRVASAYGFGDSPELIAWDKILAFARAKHLLEEPHRFFGFNNPSPSTGSPNYGYEQWITVGPDTVSEGDVTIKEFSGGLYAVTRCHGISNIGTTWQQLVIWRENSPYRFGSHQWLEECLSPPGPPWDQVVMDLYLPIAQP